MSAMSANRCLCPSPLTSLMGLYAENRRLLARLLPDETMTEGRYLSCIDDGLDLVVDVLSVHRYTLELRLSYELIDPVSGMPDPSAYVRVYRDSGQAEATHCYAGRHWQDVLGLRPSGDQVMRHRLRMNTFLCKWLDYLDGQGHHIGTLRAVGPVPVESSVERRTCPADPMREQGSDVRIDTQNA
ncbi:MAG TPA: DUF1249 domain-containing protein [Xanthomonadales bacterium]|nr:DUF1249 domain-containing protein [Xanthomonadales bacterium]